MGPVRSWSVLPLWGGREGGVSNGNMSIMLIAMVTLYHVLYIIKVIRQWMLTQQYVTRNFFTSVCCYVCSAMHALPYALLAGIWAFGLQRGCILLLMSKVHRIVRLILGSPSLRGCPIIPNHYTITTNAYFMNLLSLSMSRSDFLPVQLLPLKRKFSAICYVPFAGLSLG